MPNDLENINSNSRILLSRNSPLAFIVGVAGFIGSHMAEEMLKKGIQVLGVDDFSQGSKENLRELVRDKNFHFINKSITSSRNSTSDSFLDIKLPRLDYAYFIVDNEEDGQLFDSGLSNFLNFVRLQRDSLVGEKESPTTHDKPKIVFVSTLDLYEKDIPKELKDVKYGEIRFAKYIKEHNLNARVVRLGPVYGPRMHFRYPDPVSRLIQSTLIGELQKEQTSLDFSSRALYVKDAVNLLVKVVLSGSTSQKIYDGALLEPIKVSEIRQILLDPLWYENRDFSPTPLPPWPTPNLVKTMKELSWKTHTGVVAGLKQTLNYFKENDIKVPEVLTKKEEEYKRWSFSSPIYTGEKEDFSTEAEKGVTEEKKGRKKKIGLKRNLADKLWVFLGIGIILYGLIFPIVSLGVGAFSIRNYLRESQIAIEKGDFSQALVETRKAKDVSDQLRDLLDSISILKRIGVLNVQIDQVSELVDLSREGINGANHATLGIQALYMATKVISGADRGDPKPLYDSAQVELSAANERIAKVRVKLADNNFISSLPKIVQPKAEDLRVKLDLYGNLVERGRAAALLLPEITALNGKKSYLVLLENNLELRPGGGFIGSYAKVDFEGGRLKNIKVDDIYNLDGSLKEHVEPPIEIKNDLGQKDWFLRDSNFEPDFPSSAKIAEFFYRKESGDNVNGVIAMDLAASGFLLNAVGGVDLPDYKEHVDETNLFERAISHAEINFFPGSQAKRNYLTALQTQLLNKVFFLSKQNWPAIIQAIGVGLEQKHIQLYLNDPNLFSYAASENWAGAIPRESPASDEFTSDFIAVVDANLGANKSNYYLERAFSLETAIGKQLEIIHNLRVTYKNNSPSEVFPAGKYKNRLRVYLPLGAKLVKAVWGEADITGSMLSFSDYGRSGFSVLLEVSPGEQKKLILDYVLKNPLSFKDNKAQYKLDVIKQAGTQKDSFDFHFTYPINLSATNSQLNSTKDEQEIMINTDLLEDRSFLINLSKK